MEVTCGLELDIARCPGCASSGRPTLELDRIGPNAPEWVSHQVCASTSSPSEFVQEGFGVHEVGGIETLGEFGVDLREQSMGSLGFTVGRPKTAK
jgi:hypothetical protein